MTSTLTVRTADDLELFVRTDGRRGTRAPLVCLPGLTRNSRDFTQVAARYAADRFVVRLDFRGRGRSSYDPAGSSYTPVHYAADTVAVLDALADQRGDRQTGKDRGAQIAVQQAPGPTAKAHHEGLIEPQLGADAGNVGLGGDVAGDHRGGVARAEVEQ